jgi:hypothetical protein
MTNYRPISLFSAFCKVLEKVMCNRLSQCMYANNCPRTIWDQEGYTYWNVFILVNW